MCKRAVGRGGAEFIETYSEVTKDGAGPNQSNPDHTARGSLWINVNG